MRKLHIAIGATDIAASVADYTFRLGAAPEVVVPDEYALWRTDAVNFSIRKVAAAEAGTLRHLGWEDGAYHDYRTDTDVNGILWEYFNREYQASEIRALWPDDLP